MSNNADPLDRLVEDGNSLDRTLLADIVFPRARLYLDGETYQIRFTPEGEKLSVREKILVYLLARKALALRNVEGKDKESVSPSEIEKATGILGGTLRPTLRKLLDERLVRQDDKDGSYNVPNYSLNAIKKLLPPIIEER
jgi:hypothetical protein